jgi:hypothetical protein
MKTLKIFTVLSLALIVIGINAVYSKSNNPQNKSQVPGHIQYQVNIHPASDLSLPLPKLYVIITDEIGRLVAPAQLFTMGTGVYYFTDIRRLTSTTSSTVARLVLPSEGGWQLFKLYPYPDSKPGPFVDGKVYQFNLYPIPSVKD